MLPTNKSSSSWERLREACVSGETAIGWPLVARLCVLPVVFGVVLLDQARGGDHHDDLQVANKHHEDMVCARGGIRGHFVTPCMAFPALTISAEHVGAVESEAMAVLYTLTMS